jgi:tetratricopeptide (TPR) repeat protein
MKKINLFCTFYLFFYSVSISTAAEPELVISAGQQYTFAHRYFIEEDYRRAIDEFQRFIHFFPQDRRVAQVHWFIGMAYYKNRQYADAINAFRTIIDSQKERAANPQAWFMLAESYFASKAPGQAITALHNMVSLTDNSDIHDEANYRIGWIYVETGAFDPAQHYFAKVSGPNKVKYRLRQLTDALNKKKLIPYKNPRLAGALAIIPGAGHLYCERNQDALISFLLNGGLIYAAYEAFDNDLMAIGGLITLVESGFYTGNIYSAVNSAHKYNRSEKNKFVEKLKRNLKIRLSGSMQNKGIMLAFTYTF